MTESTTPDVVLTSEQIAGLLPHRYPFALVDRVIAHEPGVSATAIKNVTMNEPQFQGHFPERPLMPGVLICLLYTSPSPRDRTRSRMPSSA